MEYGIRDRNDSITHVFGDEPYWYQCTLGCHCDDQVRCILYYSQTPPDGHMTTAPSVPRGTSCLQGPSGQAVCTASSKESFNSQDMSWCMQGHHWQKENRMGLRVQRQRFQKGLEGWWHYCHWHNNISNLTLICSIDACVDSIIVSVSFVAKTRVIINVKNIWLMMKVINLRLVI